MTNSNTGLCSEAFSYETFCGVLLSRLKPYHDADIAPVRKTFFIAIGGVYEKYYDIVQSKRVDGEDFARKEQLNHTIFALRSIHAKYRRRATKVLQGAVFTA